MPIDKTQIKELKGNIAAARKRALNFAICLGRKPEATVFLVDRIKGPDILAKKAKSDGETQKIAFGTMTCEGNTLNLACQSDPVSELAKKTKEFLKTAELQMKVVIVGEEEGQAPPADEVEAVVEVPDDDGDAPDPDAEEWKTLRKRLAPQVRDFLKAGKGDVSKIRTAWGYAIRIGDEENDYPGAIKVGKRLEAALKAPADTGSDNDESTVDLDQRRWQVGSAKFAPVLKSALADGLLEKGPAKAIWAKAVEAAGAGKYVDALKILKILSDKIAAARKGGKPANPEPKTELIRVGSLLKAAHNDGAEGLDDALHLVRQAQTKLKEGDSAGALAAIARAETEIGQAREAREPSDELRAGPVGRKVAAGVRDIWDRACEDASVQIENLRHELAEVQDPNCQILAERGLTEFSKGMFVRLQSAFIELDRANEERLPQSMDTARKAFDEMADFLASNEAIQMIDSNDLNIPMSLGAALGGAIAEMKQTLEAG